MQATDYAVARLKKMKSGSQKVRLHLSTIGVKIVDETGDENEVLESDPIGQIGYVSVLSDKKRVAYVTRFVTLAQLRRSGCRCRARCHCG